MDVREIIAREFDTAFETDNLARADAILAALKEAGYKIVPATTEAMISEHRAAAQEQEGE